MKSCMMAVTTTITRLAPIVPVHRTAQTWGCLLGSPPQPTALKADWGCASDSDLLKEGPHSACRHMRPLRRPHLAWRRGTARRGRAVSTGGGTPPACPRATGAPRGPACRSPASISCRTRRAFRPTPAELPPHTFGSKWRDMQGGGHGGDACMGPRAGCGAGERGVSAADYTARQDAASAAATMRRRVASRRRCWRSAARSDAPARAAAAELSLTVAA